MARPKKEKELRHTHQIMLRLTDTEYEIVSTNAKNSNLPLAEYARKQIMNKKVIVKYELVADLPELKKLTAEFGKIGSNLNQIARHFNTGGIHSQEMRKVNLPETLRHMRSNTKAPPGKTHMAILKHIANKNADYGEAQRYLMFQYDEYTGKPILDGNGRLIPREEYYLDGINCDPFHFDTECKELNAQYHKNQTYDEIKSHHYILSFDPKDAEENGLTGERAQQLGLEYAKKISPDIRLLSVPTWTEIMKAATSMYISSLTV